MVITIRTGLRLQLWKPIPYCNTASLYLPMPPFFQTGEVREMRIYPDLGEAAWPPQRHSHTIYFLQIITS